MLNLELILQILSKRRPIFHSESDFQFALAWEIKSYFEEQDKAIGIRLEQRFQVDESSEIYTDIILQYENEIIPIELKYKTKKYLHQIGNEKFKLKNQSAQDINRYLYIRDIARVEKILPLLGSNIGYAIFLTNDSAYWTKTTNDVIDEKFRLHEGRELKGSLAWKKRASPGTIKGKEDTITLKNSYNLNWQNYSKITSSDSKTEFRYLLLEICN